MQEWFLGAMRPKSDRMDWIIVAWPSYRVPAEAGVIVGGWRAWSSGFTEAEAVGRVIGVAAGLRDPFSFLKRDGVNACIERVLSEGYRLERPPGWVSFVGPDEPFSGVQP